MSPTRRRLLVVARAPDQLDFLKHALEARGYAVVGTPPGEGVWAALEQSPPEVIIVNVDDRADGADPLQDLTRIKEMLPAQRFVPVLLLHPRLEAATVARGFQSGADDFLVRPFELFELALRLEVLWRMKGLHEAVLAANERLHALAITDDLTGLLNQREFKRRLGHELLRVQRFKIPVACIFFDCDHFKAVNDTHGHAMGSYVLREVARMLVANLRETDLLCRYGGDEFVLALPGSDAVAGFETADRFRQILAITPFIMGDFEAHITVSMGVSASTHEAPLGLDALLQRADKALYAAKAAGRDQVVAGS